MFYPIFQLEFSMPMEERLLTNWTIFPLLQCILYLIIDVLILWKFWVRKIYIRFYNKLNQVLLLLHDFTQHLKIVLVKSETGGWLVSHLDKICWLETYIMLLNIIFRKLTHFRGEKNVIYSSKFQKFQYFINLWSIFSRD